LEVVNFVRRTAASDWMDGVEEEDEASGSSDEGPGLRERLRDVVRGGSRTATTPRRWPVT
jgi:hypothetical protein